MKISDMFGIKQKTLAKAPKPSPAAPAGGLASTVTQKEGGAPKTLQQATQMPKPGPIPVTWPKARTQGKKNYRAILTLQELEEYLQRCLDTGYASWDYETAASEKTREKWAAWVTEYKRAMAIAAEDADRKALEKEHKERRAAYLKTPLDPWKGEICTVSISAAPDESRVVPISHKVGRNFEPGLSRDEARQLVMKTLDRMLFRNVDVLKIAVNLAFETKYTAKYGLYIMGRTADPLVMWTRCMQVCAPDRIQNPKRPTTGLGLKEMTKKTWGVEMTEFTKLLEKHGVDFFDEIDASQGDGLLYSAEDADYGLQHYLHWLPVAQQIPNYDRWLHEIEMPFGRVIGLMEYWGMAFDSNLAETKRQEAVLMQEKAKEEIKRICLESCRIEVNPGKTGKTDQVKYILFDVMKLPAAKWSEKTKDPSLDEEAIIDMRFMLENTLLSLDEEKYLAVELPENWRSLAEPNKELAENERLQRWHLLSLDQRRAIEIRMRESHPYKEAGLALLEQLQNIQKYTTLLSQHIEGRAKYLNDESGRIHANYTPWTETSRLNSNSPNGQNVPRPDKDRFGSRNFYVAPPGKILFLIDFSGFELRIMAWRSGDPVMIEIFRTGGDIHRKTASEMTGKPEEGITKKERNDAKPGNFGIAYGGTEYALQTQFKTEYKIRKTLAECMNIVNAVKRAYSYIPKFQRDIALEAREKGWVSTIYGYIRLLPHINSPVSGLRSGAERQAANTPVQGTAADVMKRSQNAVYDEIGRGTAAYNDLVTAGVDPQFAAQTVVLRHGSTDMIAQIHDEIIFEMDDCPDVVEKAQEWIKEEMEQPPIEGFPVPVEAEASVAYSWGNKKSVSEWLREKRGA